MISLPDSALTSRKLFLGVLLIAVALLMGVPMSRSVQSAGDRAGRQSPGQAKGQKPTLDRDVTKARRYPNMDIRVTEPSTVSQMIGPNSAAIVKQVQARKQAVTQGLSRLRSNSRGVEARLSPLTGAVEVLRSTTGALTGAAPGSGDGIVRAFIRDNSDLYGLTRNDLLGLHVIGESVSQGSGMRMVRVEQVVKGLPVFQSETRFILDANGRVFRSTGLMIPNAAATAPNPNLSQLVSAQEALVSAMASVDIPMDAARATLTNTSATGTETEVIANSDGIAGNVTSKLVYFPVAPGVLALAWSQVTFTNGPGDWYTLVDARTGKLLWRKNMRANVSTHDARFRVFVQADGTTPADSPAPLSPTNATVGSNTQPPGIAPTIVSMFTAMSSVASPNGWIDDCPGGICTLLQTQTIGNNVHAYMDRVGGAGAGGANDPDIAASSVLDGTGKPMGNPDVNTDRKSVV